jgi:uroporphyrinogen decarboxylase
MESRERVIATINHRPVDRMPRYGWLGNLDDVISEKYGSVRAFEDKYGFDLHHAWGNPWQFTSEAIAHIEGPDGVGLPERVLEAPMHDPDDAQKYEKLEAQIRHHKVERNRFIYVQSPGFFENYNKLFGIENHLMYLLMYPEELHAIYRRQAEWSIRWAMNCLDLGVDMIHISDDWGAQTGMMFSPQTWRDLIFPYHKMVIDAVKARGAFVSLHCDGNVSAILDGIVELGFDVMHPFQESAGMDLTRYMRDYARHFTVMGGIDVQTTLGFGDLVKLRAELERIISMFRDGGMLLCTTHSVQEHCSLEELEYCYDSIVELCG